MTHAATLHVPHHRMRQHWDTSEVIPRRAKIYYVVTVVVLLVAAVVIFIILAVNGSINDQPNTIQQHPNAANPDTSQQNTGSPNRITPSPNGAGGNTILNPAY